ncbi:hypothetical protein HD596_000362 [Nonomuraea jabiensis]|uniref:Uncharacterized protein n=1 Tax=Nonomuraea jabiensis TaxID=882448 RepID=A0A7W9L7L6_9ACTN|nr:hypothetical protein [Nonomuraea jabiensis]
MDSGSSVASHYSGQRMASPVLEASGSMAGSRWALARVRDMTSWTRPSREPKVGV